MTEFLSKHNGHKQESPTGDDSLEPADDTVLRPRGAVIIHRGEEAQLRVPIPEALVSELVTAAGVTKQSVGDVAYRALAGFIEALRQSAPDWAEKAAAHSERVQHLLPPPKAKESIEGEAI